MVLEGFLVDLMSELLPLWSPFWHEWDMCYYMCRCSAAFYGFEYNTMKNIREVKPSFIV